MPNQLVDDFFANVPKSFSDPLTGLPPRCERELSVLFQAKYQLKEMDLSKVEITHTVAESILPMSEVLGENFICLSEYPLFAASMEAINRWGSMAPDLVFLNKGTGEVVFVESKVDSHFTHSDEPPNGQLSRYLSFLASTKMRKKSLIVICPQFNYVWYQPRISRAAINHGGGIDTYITTWENIFQLYK